MGSGSSKVVINRVSHEAPVNNIDDAGHKHEEEAKVVLKRQPEITAKTVSAQATTNNNGTDNHIIVSETLKDIEERLNSCGLSEPILLSYCEQTPDLFDVFVKLYESVQQIKENIDHDDLISAVTKPLRCISSSYQSSKKSFRLKKGNLLTDIGYADICKTLLEKILASFPNMLSFIKTETNMAADTQTTNTDNRAEQSEELKKENKEEQTEEQKKENKEEQTEEQKKESRNEQTEDLKKENKEEQTEEQKKENREEQTEEQKKENKKEQTEEQKKATEEDPTLKEVKTARTFLELLLKICINYTDLCDNLNIAFSKAGLVPILVGIVEKVKDCTAYHAKFLDSNGKLTKKTARGICLSLCLGTLHNMSKRVPTRASFHECCGVDVILPLIHDPMTFFAAKALLVLAYLIDESNNELIMANEGPIKFLISIIEKAMKMTNKRYLGLSCAELANGLAQIAINDKNKKLIVANEGISVLMAMINRVNEEGQIEGVKTLWVLSFDEDNRKQMRETPGLLELLKSFKDSSNEKLKNAASGALWEIHGKQCHSEPNLEILDTSGTKCHIMISYQWDVQQLMIQVKNRLQADGFIVWMDLEQMGGSTLEAMARAVEDSVVVLICISQRYKESSNCRSEAEYAFQLKKDIIPLMMENKYRPDGWLGMIMGSKLWIDFSQGQRKLDGSCKDLIRELAGRGKDGGGEEQKHHADVVDSAPSTKVDISSWTNHDVMEWIRSFGLEVKKKNTLGKLTGSMLILLHTLRNESPDYYYSSLREEVGLYDVYSVLRFTHELELLLG